MMNYTQLFLFAGLPAAIGLIGIAVAETFRARQLKANELEAAEVEADEIAGQLEELIAKQNEHPAEYLFPSTPPATDIVHAPMNFPDFRYRPTGQLLSTSRMPGASDFHLQLRRFSNESREVSSRRSDVLVSTLRNAYGDSFAIGFRSDARLSDVLAKLDKGSFTQLWQDYKAGTLRQILLFSKRSRARSS